MKRVSHILLFALLAPMATWGCHEPQNLMANLLAQPEAAADLGYTIPWQTHLNIVRGQRLRHVAVLGDHIAAMRTGNVVSVVEALTGRIVWNDAVGTSGERMFRPVRHGDNMVICSETRMYVLNIRNGEIVRVIDLVRAVNTAPLIVGNLAIFGTPTGIVYAQHVDNGLEIWKIKTDAAITTEPALAGNVAIVGNNLGTVVAIVPPTGELLWHKQTHQKISAIPVATNLLVYVASEDQTLYAMERSTGRQRWKHLTEYPLTEHPTVIADLVIQYIPQRGMVAFDAFRGEPAWTLPFKATPIQLQGRQILFQQDSKVLRVRVQDGMVVGEVDLPRVHRVIAEKIDGGNLYLVRENGRIMKLTPKE